MQQSMSRDDVTRMVARWVPDSRQIGPIHYDTTDFFRVEYGDIVVLGERAFLVRQNAREGRFGLDDEVKYWVKRCIDLEDGRQKIIKLVFFEEFQATIADLCFDCFRSPRKEARILDLVSGHENFMHGYWVRDASGNIVRILDYIYGPSLHTFIQGIAMPHEAYYHGIFPDILRNFIECVRAIGFLHRHHEKHGDIRRDHILIDRRSSRYRWIDFDFNYIHRENMFSYDLFGLGNILIFITGMGDVLIADLKRRTPEVLSALEEKDVNIVFHNRVANLKKIFPYIPESLNRILLHFSNGAELFYENTEQLLGDLEEVYDTL